MGRHRAALAWTEWRDLPRVSEVTADWLGVLFNQIGKNTTLTNITRAYIGLAVTAHNNAALCLAKFDNVSLPGWPPPLRRAQAGLRQLRN